MFAKIQPVQASNFPAATATTLLVSNVSVNPGASATYAWALCADEKLSPALTQGNINLTGDAYAAWGNDDDYLYTYTAQQLGLTIIEIVPDAPAIIAPPLPDMSQPPMPVLADPVDAPAPVVAPSDEAAPAVDGGTDE